jgi:hypothetical protein
MRLIMTVIVAASLGAADPTPTVTTQVWQIVGKHPSGPTIVTGTAAIPAYGLPLMAERPFAFLTGVVVTGGPTGLRLEQVGYWSAYDEDGVATTYQPYWSYVPAGQPYQQSRIPLYLTATGAASGIDAYALSPDRSQVTWWRLTTGLPIVGPSLPEIDTHTFHVPRPTVLGVTWPSPGGTLLSANARSIVAVRLTSPVRWAFYYQAAITHDSGQTLDLYRYHDDLIQGSYVEPGRVRYLVGGKVFTGVLGPEVGVPHLPSAVRPRAQSLVDAEGTPPAMPSATTSVYYTGSQGATFEEHQAVVGMTSPIAVAGSATVSSASVDVAEFRSSTASFIMGSRMDIVVNQARATRQAVSTAEAGGNLPAITDRAGQTSRPETMNTVNGSGQSTAQIAQGVLDRAVSGQTAPQGTILEERDATGRLALHPETTEGVAQEGLNREVGTSERPLRRNQQPNGVTGSGFMDTDTSIGGRAFNDVRTLDTKAMMTAEMKYLSSTAPGSWVSSALQRQRPTAFSGIDDALAYTSEMVARNLEGGRYDARVLARFEHQGSMLPMAGTGPTGWDAKVREGVLQSAVQYPRDPTKWQSPSAASGDNPEYHRPYEAASGVPWVDLDDDGDLDRYNSDDPWGTEFPFIRIRWKYDKDYLRLKARWFGLFGTKKVGDRTILTDTTFALWGITKPDADGIVQEIPLLAAADPVSMYSHRKRKWYSPTIRWYFKPSLTDFFDRIPGRNPSEPPEILRFGIRWLGAVSVALDPSLAPPQGATKAPVTQQWMGSVSNNGGPASPVSTMTTIKDTVVVYDYPLVDGGPSGGEELIAYYYGIRAEMLASGYVVGADAGFDASLIPAELKPLHTAWTATQQWKRIVDGQVETWTARYPSVTLPLDDEGASTDPRIAGGEAYVEPSVTSWSSAATASGTAYQVTTEVRIHDPLAWAQIVTTPSGTMAVPISRFAPLSVAGVTGESPIILIRQATSSGAAVAGVGSNGRWRLTGISTPFAHQGGGTYRWPLMWDPAADDDAVEGAEILAGVSPDNTWTYDYPISAPTIQGGTGEGPFPGGPSWWQMTWSSYAPLLSQARATFTRDKLSWVYSRGSDFGRDPFLTLVMSDPLTLGVWGISAGDVRLNNTPATFTKPDDSMCQFYLSPSATSGVYRRADAHQGDAVLTHLEGVGTYYFKGQQRRYRNTIEQKRILEEMWTYYTERPASYCIPQYFDNAGPPALEEHQVNGQGQITSYVNRPLAEARITKAFQQGTVLAQDRNADSLGFLSGLGSQTAWLNGGVNPSLGAAFGVGNQMQDEQALVQRLKGMQDSGVFIFSAARGREWELEMALRMPTSIKLYCVEYDSLQDYTETWTQQWKYRYPSLPSWMYTEDRSAGVVRIKGARRIMDEAGRADCIFVTGTKAPRSNPDGTMTITRTSDESRLLGRIVQTFFDEAPYAIHGRFNAWTDGSASVQSQLESSGSGGGKVTSMKDTYAAFEGMGAEKAAGDYRFLYKDAEGKPMGFAHRAYVLPDVQGRPQLAPTAGAVLQSGVTVPLRHPMLVYYYESAPWASATVRGANGAVTTRATLRTTPTSAVFVRYGTWCDPQRWFGPETWPQHDYAGRVDKPVAMTAEQVRRSAFEEWWAASAANRERTHREIFPKSFADYMRGLTAQTWLSDNPSPGHPGRAPTRQYPSTPEAPVPRPVPVDTIRPGADPTDGPTAVPAVRPATQAAAASTATLLPWTFGGVTYTSRPVDPGVRPTAPATPSATPPTYVPAPNPGPEPARTTKPVAPVLPPEPIRPGAMPVATFAKPPAPGSAPVEPLPPWHGLPGYANLSPTQAYDQYVGPRPTTDLTVNYDLYRRFNDVHNPLSWEFATNPHSGVRSGIGGYIWKGGSFNTDSQDSYQGKRMYIGIIDWRSSETITATLYASNMHVYFREMAAGEYPTSWKNQGNRQKAWSWNWYVTSPESQRTQVLQQGKTYLIGIRRYGAVYPGEGTFRFVNPLFPAWDVRQAQGTVWLGDYNAYTTAMNIYSSALSLWNQWWSENGTYDADYALWTNRSNAHSSWSQTVDTLSAGYASAMAAWNLQEAAWYQWSARTEAVQSASAAYQAEVQAWSQAGSTYQSYLTTDAIWQGRQVVWNAWNDHIQEVVGDPGLIAGDVIADERARQSTAAEGATWDSVTASYQRWEQENEQMETEYRRRYAAWAQEDGRPDLHASMRASLALQAPPVLIPAYDATLTYASIMATWSASSAAYTAWETTAATASAEAEAVGRYLSDRATWTAQVTAAVEEPLVAWDGDPDARLSGGFVTFDKISGVLPDEYPIPSPRPAPLVRRTALWQAYAWWIQSQRVP